MASDVHGKPRKSLPSVLRRALEPLAGRQEQVKCANCSSMCCIQGGFATFENVLITYDEYRKGTLGREGFEFKQGLSFREFVALYFDLCYMHPGRSSRMVMFHTRLVGKDGMLVPNRVLSDTSAADRMRDLYRAETEGCVFLSKGVPDWPRDDEDTSRHCILHEDRNTTHLTAKPLHCVLYSCVDPPEKRFTDTKMASEWLRTLNDCYPDSVRRFGSLVADDSSGSIEDAELHAATHNT